MRKPTAKALAQAWADYEQALARWHQQVQAGHGDARGALDLGFAKCRQLAHQILQETR